MGAGGSGFGGFLAVVCVPQKSGKWTCVQIFFSYIRFYLLRIYFVRGGEGRHCCSSGRAVFSRFVVGRASSNDVDAGAVLVRLCVCFVWSTCVPAWTRLRVSVQSEAQRHETV